MQLNMMMSKFFNFIYSFISLGHNNKHTFKD